MVNKLVVNGDFVYQIYLYINTIMINIQCINFNMIYIQQVMIILRNII